MSGDAPEVGLGVLHCRACGRPYPEHPIGPPCPFPAVQGAIDLDPHRRERRQRIAPGRAFDIGLWVMRGGNVGHYLSPAKASETLCGRRKRQGVVVEEPQPVCADCEKVRR